MAQKTVDTRRIAVIASFVAMALIMFLIESQFPPVLAIAPGAKMGLSNIFSVLAMVCLGPVDAVIIVVMRCLLGAIFGNVSALLYSLSGGVISLIVMILLYTFIYPKISIISISIAGAVIHNIVQVFVLCLEVQTWEMVSYLPWLSVAGVLAGIIVGITSFFLIKYLPSNIYYRPKKN
jgi:heptaprenyl diphosphate synthase